jgi:hypothetical protein|eukprot:COSAG06_NODE_7231_length_2578_cov_2.012505_2_plen_100_part_00
MVTNTQERLIKNCPDRLGPDVTEASHARQRKTAAAVFRIRSSREILLNGKPLKMSAPGWELPAPLLGEGVGNPGDSGVVVPPLQVAFAVFPSAGAADCM